MPRLRQRSRVAHARAHRRPQGVLRIEQPECWLLEAGSTRAGGGRVPTDQQHDHVRGALAGRVPGGTAQYPLALKLERYSM